METRTNRRIVMTHRPEGIPTEDDFALVESPVPEAGEGEALCRTIYLSVDPYMRGLMHGVKSYVDPINVGDLMPGGTVSEVVASKTDAVAEGDLVLGHGGWQAFHVSASSSLTVLGPEVRPVSYALGVLGMPGMTAYVALLDIGQPKAGETVVISSASGAVGQVAVQIAKVKGCRVVGSAGTDEKCAWVTDTLGADACINYHKEKLNIALRRECPDGIDVYFDNVAGPMLEAVLRKINVGARIPLVGMISQYNSERMPPGPNLISLLVKRALIRGMIVSDHADRRDAFLADVGRWLKEGKIKYHESIADGLDNAPAAFIGLFSGKNFGKQLVRVSDDPTA